MNNIQLIINNFINKHKHFKKEQVEEIVSHVLLNQDYDKELYEKMIECNFELFRNKLLEQINNIIDLDCFNKLLSTSNKVESLNNLSKFIKNDEERLFSNVYKNLNKDNIYIQKIDFIWYTNKNEDIITINSQNIKFIEKKYSGNFEDYLLFIIPRITKLNKKQLDILVSIPSDFDNNTSEENTVINNQIEENNTDTGYIRLLEMNINNLQSNIQNINDTIIPRIHNLEQMVNQHLNKLNFHELQTKKSLEVLEDRILKLLEVIKTSKL
jgi:hypothetical protein